MNKQKSKQHENETSRKAKKQKKQKRERQSSEVVTYRSRTAKQQRSSYAGRKAKRQKNRKAKKQNSGKQQSKKRNPEKHQSTSYRITKKQRNSKKEMRNYNKLQTITNYWCCSLFMHHPRTMPASCTGRYGGWSEVNCEAYTTGRWSQPCTCECVRTLNGENWLSKPRGLGVPYLYRQTQPRN